jgi:hypothetical protein
MNTFLRSIVVANLLLLPATGSQQRDVPESTTAGTAKLSGVVLTSEPIPRPVRAAVVTVSGPLPVSRSVLTNDEGQFAVDGLPAGRYKVVANKAAFLPAAYGATRPGRPGTPVSIEQGQQLNVTISMTRGGVIAGVIRDRSGSPLPGVDVSAVSQRSATDPNGPDRSAAASMTDDRGRYRLFGLPPGDFIVQATPRSIGSGTTGARSVPEMDALLAALAQGHRAGLSSGSPAPKPSMPLPRPVTLSSVYFPGTPLAQDASTITLSAAGERDDVDFVVGPVASVTAEGVVSGTAGDLGQVEFSIIAAGQRTFSSNDTNPVLSVRPTASDGRFKYTNLAPGHYTILARANLSGTPLSASPRGVAVGPANGSGASPVDYMYASVDFDARDDDISGLALALQPGGTLSGRVVFDPARETAPPNLRDLRLILSPGATGYMMTNGTLIGNSFRAVAPASIADDGSFVIRGIAPGTYALRATIGGRAAESWWLRSVVVEARDLLDGPVTFSAGQNAVGAIATVSNRHTELSGTLRTAAGVAATEYFVVMFPVDSALWTPASRRMQSVRPASDGQFNIRNLPAGDYFVAALTDLDPADLNDATFLQQLVVASIRVSLADGETKTQNLTLGGGPR